MGADVHDDELVARARAVLERAWAPYSGFAVGAALVTAEGAISVGCNVENASFGLTICAERAAVASAVTSGATRFRALAVVTQAASPLMPCGACRQVLMEFAPELRVIAEGASGERMVTTLAQLLPSAFSNADLPPLPRD